MPLPIIIHHECADVATSKYLLDCLNQAIKTNPDVVLLGSSNLEPLIPKGVHFAAAKVLESPRLTKFEQVYVDLAPYYPNSLIFFRRLFLMDSYLHLNGLHEAILMDSDILLYQDLTEFPQFHDCEFACCIDENQHFSKEDTQGLRWFANCGISYWTIDVLDDFLDFLQDSYENHLDRLRVKYNYHVVHNIPGGVTEMSLLYLWVQDRPKMHFYNMSIPKDGKSFNNTIWFGVNYRDHEFRVDKHTRMKKFTIPKNGGLPIFYPTSGGTQQMYNIHFVGSAKRDMHDYQVYGHLRFWSRCRQLWQEWILHSLRTFAHGDSLFSKCVYRLGKAVKNLFSMK